MYFGNLYIIYLFSSARISSLAQRDRETETERDRARERALKAPPLLLFYISGKWGSQLSNNVVRKVGVV